VAGGGKVKRRVANKAMATFQQRVRQLSRRSGGRSLEQVAERLRSYVLGWKAYFGRRKLQRSGANWINGYATECEPSNSSNGGAVGLHIENFRHEEQGRMLRKE
jgi:hypothetical protein